MKHTQLPSTKDIFKKLFLNIQEKRNAFFLFIYAKVKRMREKKFSESITKRVTFDLKTFHSIPNYDDERGSEGINKKFPCFLYFKNQNQQTDWKQQKNKKKTNKNKQKNIPLLSVWIHFLKVPKIKIKKQKTKIHMKIDKSINVSYRNLPKKCGTWILLPFRRNLTAGRTSI